MSNQRLQAVLSEVTVKAKAHKRNNIDFSHPTICLNYQDAIDLALDVDPMLNFRNIIILTTALIISLDFGSWKACVQV